MVKDNESSLMTTVAVTSVPKPHLWPQPTRPIGANTIDSRRARRWAEDHQVELISSYRYVSSLCTYKQWLNFVSQHSNDFGS